MRNGKERKVGFWLVVGLLLSAVSNASAQDDSGKTGDDLPPLPETSNIEIYGSASGDAGAPSEVPDVEGGIPSEVEGTADVPQEYQIQTGDTLWDICQKLLDNPWYWPKLWSLNQYILNPHLIFPGNRLTFFAGSETAPPKLDIVDQTSGKTTAMTEAPSIEEAEETVREGETIAPSGITFLGNKKAEVRLKSVSFISKKNLGALTVGEITHSGEPKMELFEGDRVYLSFSKKQKVTVGDKFHVLKQVKKIANPGRGGSLGYLIKRAAVIKVVAVKKNVVDGMIIDCEDSVVRGDRVAPFVSPYRTITIHQTDTPISGQIAGAENEQFLISNNDFVYLNVGKKHGVDDGLSLVVVRRGDGLFQGEEEKKLPDVPVGHLIVVDTQESSSTAYITSLRDSLGVGERVRNQAD